MAKTEITKELEYAIHKETSKQGTFGCFEVTIGWYGDERVDYMTYNTKGEWRCYEIKCNKTDFHSKAKKTFIGNYNYYVMTKELYEQIKDEIPSYIGVYIGRVLVKRPRKQELVIDEQILKDSFIRSLYRDSKKFYDSNNKDLIVNLRSRVSRLEKEKQQEVNENLKLKRKLREKFGRKWQEILEID